MAFGISKRFLTKITLDLISLLIIGLLILFLWLFVQPYKRGFFCDDLSIRYPYKDSTINSYSLAALVLIPVFVGIGAVETYRYKNNQLTKKLTKTISREIYDKTIPFTYGLLGSLLCTLIAKASTGRLRPFFYQICKPNVLCDASNAYHYIEDFECTASDESPEEALQEMRLSFMSGHASCIIYAMVYLSVYLQVRWPVAHSSHLFLLRALIQTLAINLGFFVGYTRISDYWHHWSDVLIGLIQGMIAALLTIKFLTDFYVKDDHVLEFSAKRGTDFESEMKDGTDFHIRLLKGNSV